MARRAPPGNNLSGRENARVIKVVETGARERLDTRRPSQAGHVLDENPRFRDRRSSGRPVYDRYDSQDGR